MSLRSLITFFALVALVTGLGHFYLYRRLVHRSAATLRGRVLGGALLAFGWFALMIARPLAIWVSGAAASVVSTLAWVWLGFALYLGLSLFGFQLLEGFAWLSRRVRRAPEPSPERRLFLSRAAAGASAVIASGVSVYGTWRAFAPAELTELPVKLPRLPRALDGLTIVQITDLHVGDLIGQRFLEHVVERCNALKPDLIALTGDLVDGSVKELAPTIATLQRLRSRYGTFFVTGNHEYYSGADAWCDALAKMGMTVLRNRTVSVGEKGASFDLVGVDDWGAHHYGFKRGYDLDAAVAGRDLERAAVLLAHEPAGFDDVPALGLGLQLSGHTHGGQLFPITLAVKLRWHRARGHYALGDSQLYVSRGTGFWGAPMRVGSPPEILKVTLVT